MSGEMSEECLQREKSVLFLLTQYNGSACPWGLQACTDQSDDVFGYGCIQKITLQVPTVYSLNPEVSAVGMVKISSVEAAREKKNGLV